MPLILMLVRKRGFRGWRSKKQKIKGRKAKKNSDVRRGLSPRSFTVRDVGCEAHEERWDGEVGLSSRKAESYPLIVVKGRAAKG